MYPDVANFDSIAVTVVPDSIVVQETENKNEFVVTFGNGVDITVIKEGEDKIKITSSHGLLLFDKETMDFAKKTGQWKVGLTDKQLAERMNDKGFDSCLIANFEKEFITRLSITHTVPNSDYEALERESIYTIKNNSSKQIDGSDYQLIIPFFEESYMGDAHPRRWTETRNGKTIDPNGKVTYTEYIITERGDFSRSGPVYSGHKIRITISGKVLFNKYYECTGNEYNEYLAAKK